MGAVARHGEQMGTRVKGGKMGQGGRDWSAWGGGAAVWLPGGWRRRGPVGRGGGGFGGALLNGQVGAPARSHVACEGHLRRGDFNGILLGICRFGVGRAQSELNRASRVGAPGRVDHALLVSFLRTAVKLM